MAAENLTTTNQINVTAREVDFVSRFTENWQHLLDLFGIMRPIKKTPGTVLKSKKAGVTLKSGNVSEGEEIPYSQATVVETDYDDVKLEKFRKGVTVEAINKYGYDVAVQKTDDAFLNELQRNVTDRFYAYLNTGTLSVSETNWQKALAMAKGAVINKFKQMHLTVTDVVGFANVLDLYDYLGSANITVQSAFGYQYIKDFLGYSTIFLLSDEEIPRGRVIATPIENIDLYYVDPSDSDFARAGLEFTVDGELPIIGFHVEGNYGTAVSDAFALMGMTLFSEYIDGIAVADVDTTPTLGTLTVSSAAGTTAGKTKLTVTPEKEAAGNVYKYKAASAAAPTVVYGQNVRSWSNWDGVSELAITNGYKVTVVEADSTFKALNAGNATVASKTE